MTEKTKKAKNSKHFNFNVRTQINKTFCVLYALKGGTPEHLFDTQLAAFSKVHQALGEVPRNLYTASSGVTLI